MTHKPLRAILIPAVLVAAVVAPRPAAADEVHLLNGRVLHGETRAVEDGLEIVGPRSVTVVPMKDISHVVESPAPWVVLAEREALLPRPAADAPAAERAEASRERARLADWCESRDMPREARRLRHEAIALDPGNEEAQRALGRVRVDGEWMSEVQAHLHRGEIWYDGRWMPKEMADLLRAVAARERGETAAGRELRRALDAMIADGDVEAHAGAVRQAPDDVLEPMLIETVNPWRHEEVPEAVRAFAAETLAETVSGDDPQARINALVRSSLLDPSPDVRARAVRAVQTAGRFRDPAMPYLVSAYSRYPAIRVASYEALKQFPTDPRATRVLVTRWRWTSGGTPRGHVFVANDFAYVEDFDVEIAVGSVIADPLIDSVRSGVVLDAQATRMSGSGTTIERRAIRDSLIAHAGRDLGGDVRAWIRWYNETFAAAPAGDPRNPW